MKMRKSTWLLLVLALVAIFLVAGCEPTTPTPTPPENGEEPTPPPADKECPEVVSTVVSKMYAWEADDPNFKITITFNENINSQCADNPTNWLITISNPLTSRADKRFLATDNYTGTGATGKITITDIDISGKKIVIEASAVEDENAALGEEFFFEGLICSPADAEKYYDSITNTAYWEDDEVLRRPPDPDASPKYSIDYADEICWKLSNNCVVSDELGNGCCGYDGCACCVEPVCEECEEYCPMGEETCL